jgi:hypothetical protein
MNYAKEQVEQFAKLGTENFQATIIDGLGKDWLALHAEVDRLRDMLEAVEWGDPESVQCPWCRAYISSGHIDGCELKAALLKKA